MILGRADVLTLDQARRKAIVYLDTSQAMKSCKTKSTRKSHVKGYEGISGHQQPRGHFTCECPILTLDSAAHVFLDHGNTQQRCNRERPIAVDNQNDLTSRREALVLRKNCDPQALKWRAPQLWHDRSVLSAFTTIVRLAWDLIQWCGLLLRPRNSLEAENLFLRRQLALYRERGVKPKRVDAATRVTLALLSLFRLA